MVWVLRFQIRPFSKPIATMSSHMRTLYRCPKNGMTVQKHCDACAEPHASTFDMTFAYLTRRGPMSRTAEVRMCVECGVAKTRNMCVVCNEHCCERNDSGDRFEWRHRACARDTTRGCGRLWSEPATGGTWTEMVCGHTATGPQCPACKRTVCPLPRESDAGAAAHCCAVDSPLGLRHTGCAWTTDNERALEAARIAALEAELVGARARIAELEAATLGVIVREFESVLPFTHPVPTGGGGSSDAATEDVDGFVAMPST
jgi:hypothetical protein